MPTNYPVNALRGRLTSPLAAAIVLLAFWIFLIASLRDKSITADEGVHAMAGYTYWKFNDYRMNPENGNLPQRVMALPLLSGRYRFPPTDSAAWRTSDGAWVTREWFDQMGNDVSDMLRRGRAVCGLMAVALGALVWGWARSLFGAGGGMLALLLFVLNPTVLANGALMTSDTACALFFLASTWSAWALLHRVTPGRVALSAVVMGGLFISKMSALLIVPVLLIMVVARLIDGRPLPVAIGLRRELGRRSQQAWLFCILALVHGLVVWAVIWGAFGFRYRAFASDAAGTDRHPYPWEAVLDQTSPANLLGSLKLNSDQEARIADIFSARGLPSTKWWTYGSAEALAEVKAKVLTATQVQALDARLTAPLPTPAARLMEFLNRHELLPEAYIYGYAHAWYFAQQRPSFFNGEFGIRGWKLFFPYTFLVKTPLPLFGVMVLALAAAMAKWRVSGRALYPTLPLWALLACYWAAVVAGHLNIGHRHILATYPPLFVLCGAAVYWVGQTAVDGVDARERKRQWRGAALYILMAALAADVLGRFPNYIAYFNGLVTTTKAYRHLVDSSLDWGQDLPAVKRYIADHPAERPYYLAYFGRGNPDYYAIPASRLHTYADDRTPLPLRILALPASGAAEALSQQLQQMPDYDLAGSQRTADGGSLAVLLKKPSALGLSGGTYLISATQLQPVVPTPLDGPFGPWNERYEARYQRLYALVKPLFSDNLKARSTALFTQHTPSEWQTILNAFEVFRFARLTAWLRLREPDETLNGSILVYRLSDADLVRALDGPAPELGQDVPRLLYGDELAGAPLQIRPKER